MAPFKRLNLWRTAATASAGLVAALALGSSPSHAHRPGTVVQASAGDTGRGFMTLPLWRGAAVPDEFLVKATPGNCRRHIQATYIWDESANWVRLRLRGHGVLEALPSIERTEGVDYFPNPFWPEPEDFEDGRYQFWTIAGTDVTTFYYSAVTLELLGSEWDFETAPEAAIPVELPTFSALPTPFFQPDENGNVDVTFEYEYDQMLRGDLPEFAHTLGSFIPHTLCKTDPFRYDRTSTRPYATTLPASEAKSFREFLRNGLVFDLTIEPPSYHAWPPLTTMAGVYSNAAAVAGNVPLGWSVDFEAVFAGLAPPIRRFPTADTCVDYFKPKRDRDFDVCAPPPGGAP